jgi:hypothetical protein
VYVCAGLASGYCVHTTIQRWSTKTRLPIRKNEYLDMSLQFLQWTHMNVLQSRHRDNQIKSFIQNMSLPGLLSIEKAAVFISLHVWYVHCTVVYNVGSIFFCT